MPDNIDIDIQKTIITFVLGFLSWILKDWMFKSISSRDESLKREWEYRLKEVWSPLYYWTGILFFSGKEIGWLKHGISQIEKIISSNAHLIPKDHYYVLIKMIEEATGQNTTGLSIETTRKTRNYICKQIEILNFLLYKNNIYFDLKAAVDPFIHYKVLLRVLSSIVLNIAIWAIIFGVFWISYALYVKGNYVLISIIIVILVIIAIYEIKQRFKIKKSFEIHLK